MEYDSLRAGNFEPLRFVPAGKTIALGLNREKAKLSLVVETAEEVWG